MLAPLDRHALQDRMFQQAALLIGRAHHARHVGQPRVVLQAAGEKEARLDDQRVRLDDAVVGRHAITDLIVSPQHLQRRPRVGRRLGDVKHALRIHIDQIRELRFTTVRQRVRVDLEHQAAVARGRGGRRPEERRHDRKLH